MKEEWKDIDKFESLYMISNLGRVMSKQKQKIINIRRGNKRSVLSKQRILKCSTVSKGYKMVELKKPYAYCGTPEMVHRLVYSHFVGKIPKGYVVDHINNVPYDNRYVNLQAITYKENLSKDKVKMNKDGEYNDVYKIKGTRLFSTSIEINGEEIFLGTFDDGKLAAKSLKSIQNVLKYRPNISNLEIKNELEIISQ